MKLHDTHTTAAGLRRRLQALFQPAAQQPTAGLYCYDRHGPGWKARVHLRLDPDGRGLLLVNANRVVHLNPTAAWMAQQLLEGTSPEETARRLAKRYRVAAPQALADSAQFADNLEQIIHPDGLCPVHELDLEVTLPFSARPSAPYRMDLALSYGCNNDCAHCYNARPRDLPSLGLDEWKTILDRLWEVGIPHVVFTGGEPTLFPHLPELIAHAQANGQITGVNTNGRRLQDRRFVEQLVNAGLDHVQITFESHDAAVHDRMVQARGAWKQTVAGLRNVLDSPLFVMTNTTLLRDNRHTLGQTLQFLSDEGVPTVGLNALIYAGAGATVGTGLHESELPPLLDLARRHTDEHHQRLIWYTPTQYCRFDPMQLELGVKGCTAALYNMCVEPDGAVIPCQSYYQPLGNLLHDPWQAIWNHDLAVSLRERRYVAAKCKDCALLPECGGGCPLSPPQG